MNAVDHEALQRSAYDHLLLHFARNGAFGPDRAELLVLERGEGPYVFDTQGRRYVDGLSNLFCCQIGYSYGEEMASAAAEQLTRLPFNTNWGTAHPPAIELAERLAGLAPEGINKVFFTSGGSEAVELAWKVVRQYHLANGEPQRVKAIARDTAYHGVTLGALSLTGVPRFKEAFGTPAIPTRHVSNTNRFRRETTDSEWTDTLLAELEATIEEEGPETIALLVAEPVQNAGGSLVPPSGYWGGLREICDRHGILLLADEVISGCGRIGEWFAVERFGAVPDLITIAKGLTSAYASMGATLVHERVAEVFYRDGVTLLHGITFGGHPLSASIALKNIEIFEREQVLANVRQVEPYLKARLEEELLPLPIVGDIRGAGLFWSVELVRDEDNSRFEPEEIELLVRSFLPKRLLEAGLIARPDDRGDVVIQIAPPLISDDQVLDEIVAALKATLIDAGAVVGLGSAATAAR
jgi:adenosylmethionine-8-amino-7-oxononanoate aminotransferase